MEEVRRLVHPLTGSTTWVEMNGTTVVRKAWNGRANLVELEADGPNGHFEGLSLRLYNPESHQWSLHFANAAAGMLLGKDGEVGIPMAQTFFASRFGQLRDRFGTLWSIICERPA